MKILISNRSLFLLGLLSCMATLGVALYFQWVVGLNPCALCIFQRIAVIAAGILFLIAAIHHPRRLGNMIYVLMIAGVLGLGLTVALRQVWLQHLPTELVPACGPGLNYLLKVLPLQKAIVMVFQGSGDCAKVDWRFLGLSMAGWSAIWFAGMLLITIGIAATKLFKNYTKRIE